LTIIELVLSLAAILGAAILFTNAVEIMGDRLNLGAGAVGSVLAAVGTALPETMIPLDAIFGALLLGSGSAAAGEIGIRRDPGRAFPARDASPVHRRGGGPGLQESKGHRERDHSR